MPDRIYAKDPVPVRDNRKLYAVIFAAIALFLILQIGVKLWSGKQKTGVQENLVEDKGRTVFKEDDVVRGLAVFGKGARESALSKLREKEARQSPQTPGMQKERLAP